MSVSFLAWSVLEFPGAYAQADATTPALNNVRLAATYLADCHTADYKYVGQIGDPGPDHAYWGRPEQQPGSRPAYTWTAATPASDLLGAVSAALSSTSLLFKTRDPAFAAKQLSHAKQLYAWGKKYPGDVWSRYFPVWCGCVCQQGRGSRLWLDGRRMGTGEGARLRSQQKGAGMGEGVEEGA